MEAANSADVVRRYCDAWLAGDTGAVVAMYHPDLTLTWPGTHPLAGDYVGLDASLTALIALQDITGRRPIAVVDILVGSHSVMAVVVERWNDGNASLECTRVLDYTVADGRLRSCRVYEQDQVSVDRWIHERMG